MNNDLKFIYLYKLKQHKTMIDKSNYAYLYVDACQKLGIVTAATCQPPQFSHIHSGQFKV